MTFTLQSGLSAMCSVNGIWLSNAGACRIRLLCVAAEIDLFVAVWPCTFVLAPCFVKAVLPFKGMMGVAIFSCGAAVPLNAANPTGVLGL